MGTSLWNLFDNPPPGVPWLATTVPANEFAGRSEVVRGNITTARATEQIDSSYIANGTVSYVARFLFIDSRIAFNLATSASANFDVSDDSGPHFTDDALLNLGLAIRLNNGSVYSWRIDLFSDTAEPYNWNPASDGGDAVDSAVINEIRAATSIQSILVNRNHSNIDFDLLQTVDAPPAPAAPTLAATADGITVTLTADPTSDATIDTRDIRWKRTADDDTAWTEVDSVTSPHTISSLAAQTQYEVQWRAVSAADDGAWSPSATITTPASLALADFAVPSGHVLDDDALFTRGAHATNLYRDDDPNTTASSDTGTLDDGDSLTPTGGPRISRIRLPSANALQLNDNPNPTDLGAFFDAGAGNDLTIHLQDAQGVASFAVADVTVTQTPNFARFTVPVAFETILSRIQDGDRFIIAFTREAVYRLRGTVTVPAPSAAARIRYTEPLTGTIYRLRGAVTVPAPSAAARVNYTEPPPPTYNLRGAATVPAPSAAARIKYTQSVNAVPLTVPDGAEILPALAASIDGAARWPGGLMAGSGIVPRFRCSAGRSRRR